jgi:hypothetical protein
MKVAHRIAPARLRAAICCIAAVGFAVACGHPADRQAATGEPAGAAADAIDGAGVKNPVDAQLFRVVAANDAGAAAALIDQGADTNALDVLGRTPLYTAAFYKRSELAKLLLAHGAKVNVGDTTGLTPLHAAVLAGSVEVAALLIDAGAGINARSSSGKTPLHLAAATGQLELARLLLIDGADKSIRDNHGETAVTLGEKNRHHATVALIAKLEGKP